MEGHKFSGDGFGEVMELNVWATYALGISIGGVLALAWIYL